MFPRSTHETFAQKLYQTFKDHKRFVKPKLSRTDFTICHYAGDVSILIPCYVRFVLSIGWWTSRNDRSAILTLFLFKTYLHSTAFQLNGESFYVPVTLTTYLSNIGHIQD